MISYIPSCQKLEKIQSGIGLLWKIKEYHFWKVNSDIKQLALLSSVFNNFFDWNLDFTSKSKVLCCSTRFWCHHVLNNQRFYKFFLRLTRIFWRHSINDKHRTTDFFHKTSFHFFQSVRLLSSIIEVLYYRLKKALFIHRFKCLVELFALVLGERNAFAAPFVTRIPNPNIQLRIVAIPWNEIHFFCVSADIFTSNGKGLSNSVCNIVHFLYLQIQVGKKL